MARIIVAFDPHEKLERGPLPNEIKWAQIDINGNLNPLDAAEIAEQLVGLLLNNL